MRLFECLQAAQRPKGSVERLLLVAAFAQSAFQAVGKLKAMVPIMGETYEVHLHPTFQCRWQSLLGQLHSYQNLVTERLHTMILPLCLICIVRATVAAHILTSLTACSWCFQRRKCVCWLRR